MTTLYANPYDVDALGFTFETLEEFETRAAVHVNRYGQPVEEYDIDFIDGASDQARFAGLFKADQCDLAEWFEHLEIFEGLENHEQVAIVFLSDCSYFLEQCFAKYEDVMVFEGTLLDCAYEYVDSCLNLEETMGELARYFDYEAFARDCELGGDWSELRFNGSGYVIQNANSI